MSVRRFLSFMDYSPEELIDLIRRGGGLKDLRDRDALYEPLKSRALDAVFEKASTHARLFFEAGMIQLNDQMIFPSPRDTQLGHGEPIGDSARVMSRMLDGVMIRTFTHVTLTEFTARSRVPVINDLSDDLHPCQLLTDMQTFHEYRGSVQGKAVARIDGGGSMCNSYIEAALRLDFQLCMACLEGCEPKAELVALAGDRLRVIRNPREAVTSAHLVSTDVWASVGQGNEAAARIALFRPHQANAALLDGAVDDILFIHCLPAHRGEEISEELPDDPCSVAWD